MATRLTLALVLATLVSAAPAVAALTPHLGRTAVVNTVSGKVLVKDRGERRFSELPRSATAIHMGATLDATNGHVRVRTAAGPGEPLNNGVFWDGAFKISQARKPGGLTDLKLVGGDLRDCNIGARASRVVQRRLWGDAHGNVRTHGHNGSGTVRGTKWMMEDRCDGTLTVVRRGTVQTDVNGQLVFDVDAGQVVHYFCDFGGQAPISRLFCIVALNKPVDGLWAAGILYIGDASSYDLCLTDPSGQQRCGTFAFSAPDSDGFRDSAVACTTDAGPGNYTLRWFVNGVRLGPPIDFTNEHPPNVFICTSGNP